MFASELQFNLHVRVGNLCKRNEHDCVLITMLTYAQVALFQVLFIVFAFLYREGLSASTVKSYTYQRYVTGKYPWVWETPAWGQCPSWNTLPRA